MTVALVAMLLTGGAILVVALEGVICLIMALPIVMPIAFLGAVVGYAIQSRPWLSDRTAALTIAVVIALPGFMAAESANEPEAALRSVETEVHIDAPREQVWNFVLAFPPLPEPDD